MQKVTVKALEAAKPRDDQYKLTVDPGLYLRVARDGRKTWLVRYMADGRQRQIRLPKPYGSSGAGFMSLHEARTENARVQALARAGIDVQVQEAEARDALKLQRVAQKAANATVGELFTTRPAVEEGHRGRAEAARTKGPCRWYPRHHRHAEAKRRGDQHEPAKQSSCSARAQGQELDRESRGDGRGRGGKSKRQGRRTTEGRREDPTGAVQSCLTGCRRAGSPGSDRSSNV